MLVIFRRFNRSQSVLLYLVVFSSAFIAYREWQKFSVEKENGKFNDSRLLETTTGSLTTVSTKSPDLEVKIPTKPFMAAEDIDFLMKYLTNVTQANKIGSTKMLEFGSGHSTFFFSQYVTEYTSIEHDFEHCESFERLSSSTSDRKVTISYMNFKDGKFVKTRVLTVNNDILKPISNINLYCVKPETNSAPPFHILEKPSSYSMYQKYVDFVPMYLSNEKFDLILIDDRARPQVAYRILNHLNGDKARVFIHDWNGRPSYNVVQEFYDIIDSSTSAGQPSSNRIVALKKKDNVDGTVPIENISWKNITKPTWWI